MGFPTFFGIPVTEITVMLCNVNPGEKMGRAVFFFFFYIGWALRSCTSRK